MNFCILNLSLTALRITPVFLLLPMSASAQVTYFRSPPDVAEVRQALLKRAGDSAVGKEELTRGIQLREQPEATSGSSAERFREFGQSNSAAVALPITFTAGSTKVSQLSLSYLEVIAETLRGDPGMALIIEGHTDATGDQKRNLVLSWERALTVYKTLVYVYAVDPAKLKLLGKGALEPIEGVDPKSDMQRRVQFRLAG